MLDDMRKYVRLGLEALSAPDPHDAGAKRSRAQAVAEQISTLAAGFLEWSAEGRASLLQELRDLVSRQVEEMGVATKKDLDVFRARLERLEAKLGAPAKTGGGVRRTESPQRATSVRGAKSAGRPKSAKGSSPSRAGRPKAASSSRKKTASNRARASRGPR